MCALVMVVAPPCHQHFVTLLLLLGHLLILLLGHLLILFLYTQGGMGPDLMARALEGCKFDLLDGGPTEKTRSMSRMLLA